MAHSDQAALRGEPSYVWRAGQERRLQMMARWAQLSDARVLVAGCGVGMYARQIRQRFTSQVDGFDIEFDRARSARAAGILALTAAGEHIPFAADRFDTVLSHEVLEHVVDDRRALQEMLRVTRVGGRILLFCPNRWYPFETHGHYWRGKYYFGNTPLINYLPAALRDRLAPHVRAYTARDIRRLLADDRALLVHHQRIFGGYDNLITRLGAPASALRSLLQRCEGTRLDFWALSHFLVVQKRG
ncbi:MAG: class I SAM-dependent methyltransferase [Chloroflexi bacterium]|nr:class I SAM-dependent methyltransferase [Chloroflexota bacterium]MCY4247975.1 class I SAM-dependent methyltransferase [Chloroflexota bacterium]